MANVSEAPWDGSASNYATAADYADACLINTNIGPRQGWTKAKASLPYKTPSGAISRAGCAAAAAALAGGRTPLKASPALKARAKSKLRSVYLNELDVKEDDLPPALK